jgi:hypothetical protein
MFTPHKPDGDSMTAPQHNPVSVSPNWDIVNVNHYKISRFLSSLSRCRQGTNLAIKKESMGIKGMIKYLIGLSLCLILLAVSTKLRNEFSGLHPILKVK